MLEPFNEIFAKFGSRKMLKISIIYKFYEGSIVNNVNISQMDDFGGRSGRFWAQTALFVGSASPTDKVRI